MLNICVSYSQEPFGAQFKSWVLSDATNDSRELAKADFQDRVLHTISRIDEQLIRNIKVIDSTIGAIYYQIQQDEKSLTGLDSLQATLQRARSARLAHYRLLEIENLLYFSSRLKTNLDSLGSPTYFYSLGLYHVGRETLLESYASIGEQFADNFQLKYQNDYTISFSTTINDGGDMTGGAEVGQPGMFTVLGGAIGTGVGGMAGGIGAIPGGVIGSVVGGSIDYFLGSKKAKEAQEKAEKEFKKQMKLLQEGIEDLPSQLTPVDSLLGYYKGYVKQFSDANSVIYQHIDTTLQLQQQRFKEIFSYNVRRQYLSHSQLTADRILQIEKTYMSLEELRNFYSNLSSINFTKDCNLMFNRLKAEDNWLRNSAMSKFDWLQRSEAFQDDLQFALLLVQQFLAEETYIPHQQYLKRLESELESMARNLPIHPILAEKSILKSLSTDRAQKFAPAPTQSSLEIASINEQSYPVMPNSIYAKAIQQSDFGFGLCFSGGGYTWCEGMNDGSYGDRFNNGGRTPVTDILGSSHDGGLRTFNVTATKQINSMKENIHNRVTKLKDDYSKLQAAMPEVREHYSLEIKHMTASALGLGTLSSGEISAFEQEFATTMPEIQQRLDQFMNQPLRSGLSDLKRDLKLQRLIKDQIPVANRPMSIFRIGNVDFGFPTEGGNPAIMQAWEREAGKQINLLKDIDRRISNNNDPVFNNRRDFDAFKDKLIQLDRLLNNVNNNGQFSFEDQQKISAHYLTQAIKMRYAASGNLPASELNPTDYPFLDRENLDLLKDLVDDFRQCNSDEADCASSYSAAIYQVYHNNTIASLRNNEGQSFNAVNLLQLATGSSSWEAVGPASSASTVNQAALLAMSGNIVIAARTDGMDTRIGILLPELPATGTQGSWKGLPVPLMFYLDEDKPDRSFGRDRMSVSFPEPDEVTFYTSRLLPSFNNKTIAIQDKGIRPFEYSDPVYGEKGTVPSILFSIQTNNGGVLQTLEQTIPLAGDYVGHIVKQYGNNSRQVFENIYAHRDEIYGAYPVAPEDLNSEENRQLQNLRQSVEWFEDKDKLLSNPEDLYYCETSRSLYNSCITEINKSDPLDRIKILDYYNQVEAALIKYHDDALDVFTMFTPGINDARDLYEFVTGMDLIKGEQLTIWQRGLSGAGLIIGSGAFYRQIDNLPYVSEVALKIAKEGIPDFKMIQMGDLQYCFQSKGGIYYERWSSKINNDRFTKIVEEHYLNPNKSRFNVNHHNEIPAMIDKAWQRAKDLHLVPTIGRDGNIRYIVNMDEVIGKKGETFINLIFEKGEGPFIVTAFPSLSGKYPRLD